MEQSTTKNIVYECEKCGHTETKVFPKSVIPVRELRCPECNHLSFKIVENYDFFKDGPLEK